MVKVNHFFEETLKSYLKCLFIFLAPNNKNLSLILETVLPIDLPFKCVRFKKLAKLFGYLFGPQLHKAMNIFQLQFDMLRIVEILRYLLLKRILCVVGAGTVGVKGQGHVKILPLVVIPLISLSLVEDKTHESFVTLRIPQGIIEL